VRYSVASVLRVARSRSDLCFYAIKDGEVVNDDTRGNLFQGVNTSAHCTAAPSACPSEEVSVSSGPYSIGVAVGTGGGRGSSCSPTKLLEEQPAVLSTPPICFCSLQLKVTFQTVRLLLTQKFSRIPQLLGLCSRPEYTLRILFCEKYILHKVIL